MNIEDRELLRCARWTRRNKLKGYEGVLLIKWGGDAEVGDIVADLIVRGKANRVTNVDFSKVVEKTYKYTYLKPWTKK